MYRIPSGTFLYGIIGRPIVLDGFSLGKMILILFHNSFGILSNNTIIFFIPLILDTSHALTVITASYNSIEFWDRL